MTDEKFAPAPDDQSHDAHNSPHTPESPSTQLALSEKASTLMRAPRAGHPLPRPASLLKGLARVSWGTRMRVLEEIADGEPMVKVIEVYNCPHCLAEPELRVQKMSASPRDRILAIAELSKIGFTSVNLSMEEVGSRLEETYQALAELLTTEQFKQVDERLARIWA